MSEQQLYVVEVVSLSAMVVFALWAAMTTYLLRAVVGLALISAVVSVLMFLLKAPMAAVFELSVCAGLIPAIFLSAISITRKQTPMAKIVEAKDHLKKFWLLPLLVMLAGLALTQIHVHLPALVETAAPAASKQDVRQVLWSLRHMDLLGQIVILLGGAFGVAVLVKGAQK